MDGSTFWSAEAMEMTSAICFKCGCEKFGAFAGCELCGASPRTEDELCLSLVLCEHLSSKSQLAIYSNAIGKDLGFTILVNLLDRAREALKDPQLMAMLFANLPAQTTTPPNYPAQPPPEQKRVASSQPPSQRQRKLKESALHKNAFFLLGASTRDDKRRILELAEEKSLERDHDVCQKARSDLTVPRTRLAVEMAWLPGISPKRAFQLANQLLLDPMAVREESGVPSLAHANLMAAVFEVVDAEDSVEDIADFIVHLASLVDEISSEEIMRDINEDRAVSRIPEVNSLDLVEAELVERKRYFRSAIYGALARLPEAKMIEVMTDAVDISTTCGEIPAPELIDALVDNYELETKPLLQKEAESIFKLIRTARDAAKSGEAAVKQVVDELEQASRNWVMVAYPIHLSARARGLDNELSNELAYSIRSLAVDIFNEHDMLMQSQRITILLQELFADLPEASERIEQDADTLQAIFQNRKEVETSRNEWAREITYRAEIGMVFKDTLGISPDGVVWKNKRYPLDAITRVRWGAIRNSVNSIPTGTFYIIGFGDNQSEAVVELKRYAVYSHFIDKLWRAVGVRLLTQLLEGLKAGKEVQFKEAFLRDDGITLERHKFFGANELVRCGWHQVQVWSADGSFYIGAKGDKKTYVGLSYIYSPNTHILEQAIQMVFKKPGTLKLSGLLE